MLALLPGISGFVSSRLPAGSAPARKCMAAPSMVAADASVLQAEIDSLSRSLEIMKLQAELEALQQSLPMASPAMESASSATATAVDSLAATGSGPAVASGMQAWLESSVVQAMLEKVDVLASEVQSTMVHAGVPTDAIEAALK